MGQSIGKNRGGGVKRASELLGNERGRVTRKKRNSVARDERNRETGK